MKTYRAETRSSEQGGHESRVSIETDSLEEFASWAFSTLAEDFDLPLLLETTPPDEMGVITMRVQLAPTAVADRLDEFFDLLQSGIEKDMYCSFALVMIATAGAETWAEYSITHEDRGLR
jgi:hypothetical protein